MARGCSWALAKAASSHRRGASRWRELRLDALVCPGLGVPAFPHGLSTKLNQACSYTFLWNNFHFPAGTVPVTTVRDDEQHYSSGFSDTLSANAKAAAAGSAGLPVGVQVGGSAHPGPPRPPPNGPPAGRRAGGGVAVAGRALPRGDGCPRGGPPRRREAARDHAAGAV